MATEKELRKKVATWGDKYLGISEGSAQHREILKIYNDSKLCPRYTMTVNDAWCQTFASSAGIACGLSDIIPVECSCQNAINLWKSLGRWKEDDAYIPSQGDYIYYDWDDNGVGDCTGWADHVGIVYAVSGNTITVIEGNYSDSVKKRNLAVNARYIRGYGLPDYAKKATGATTPAPTKTVDELAREVLAGKWGNGSDRKNALEAAGYNYSAVQTRVNELVAGSKTQTQAPTLSAGKTINADPKAVWDYLIGKIGNAFGVAGLMGNLYAESALRPCNLQNTYEKSLGYTDEAYTDAVDNGSYTNFVRDSAGYGLAQWTYWSRKEAFLKYAQSKKSSIGNLTTQLEFLYKELSENYSGVLSVLKNAKSVQVASDEILTKFERPADQSDAVKTKRAGFGEGYYKTYAGSAQSTPQPQPVTPQESKPQEIKIDYAASHEAGHSKGTTLKVVTPLNMRSGAGTSKKIVKVLKQGDTVTWYGYYTLVGGVRWYLVIDKTGQTGFCSSVYLKA